MARPVRCVIMRGGTSKAVFLREADLPVSPEERLQTILAIFGSPDPRQIDGLGGADPLTSKVAIIGPVRAGHPRAAHTHLTYTFGQVEIAAPEVDYISLCGNISSAVGAYAVYEGFVEPTEPVTVVRVYNTNLDRVLTLEVPVQGRPAAGARRLRGAWRPGHGREDSRGPVRHRGRGDRFAAADRTTDRSSRRRRRRRHRRVARRHRQRARVRARARCRAGRHRNGRRDRCRRRARARVSNAFAARRRSA